MAGSLLPFLENTIGKELYVVSAISNVTSVSGLFARSSDALTFQNARDGMQEEHAQQRIRERPVKTIESGGDPKKVETSQVTAIAPSTFSELLRFQETAPQTGKNALYDTGSAIDTPYLVLSDSYSQAKQAGYVAIDSRQERVVEATAAVNAGIARLSDAQEALSELNAENRELLDAYRFLLDYRKPGLNLDFTVVEQGTSFNLERVVNGQSTGRFSTRYQSVKDAINSHLQAFSNIDERSRDIGLIY